MPRADGRADGPPGWGVSSSRRLAGATPEELTAAQACDGIGAAVQVEEEQLRIRRSAAPARGRLGRDRICACGRRHLGQDSPVVGSRRRQGRWRGVRLPRGHFRHLPQQLRTPKAPSLAAPPGTELPAISSTPVSREPVGLLPPRSAVARACTPLRAMFSGYCCAVASISPLRMPSLIAWQPPSTDTRITSSLLLPAAFIAAAAPNAAGSLIE